MYLQRGFIDGFQGTWGSGLGHLIVNGIPVPCDNGPTVRALESAFGDVITDNHSVNQSGIQGREIIYALDEFGLVLEWFCPVEDWTGPEVPEEGLTLNVEE